METKTNVLDSLANLSVDIQSAVTSAILALLIVFLCFGVWMLISRGLNSLEKNSRFSQSLLFPIRMALRYGIIIAGGLFVVSAFGIPIGNFWTLLSTVLGLVAIGFVAVWSVLSNISATFFILGLKPFSVGDDINLEGTEICGTVVNLDFMFTTIRKSNGDVFKIPNNLFFQKATFLPSSEEVRKRENENPSNQSSLVFSESSQS